MIQKQTRKDRIIRVWFWLTCWRPVTKYEMGKMYQTFIKFGMAVEKDHIRFNDNLILLNKQVGIKTKDDKENIDRGMYI